MAHFAELDDNNIVLRDLVVDNKYILDENGIEQESIGQQYLTNRFGGHWLKTSYNTYGNKHLNNGTPFRKNYAGIGLTYDANKDAFIYPKPPDDPNNPNRYVLSEETFLWVDTLAKDISIGVTRI